MERQGGYDFNDKGRDRDSPSVRTCTEHTGECVYVSVFILMHFIEKRECVFTYTCSMTKTRAHVCVEHTLIRTYEHTLLHTHDLTHIHTHEQHTPIHTHIALNIHTHDRHVGQTVRRSNSNVICQHFCMQQELSICMWCAWGGGA